MMAIAGESPSLSLKLLRLPPESIREDTRVPTAPDGTPEFSTIAVNFGLALVSRIGGSGYAGDWKKVDNWYTR